jgi:3-oxoacyl-[acyl-carrier-protein] synthase-3
MQNGLAVLFGTGLEFAAMMAAKVLGTGAYLPERVVTNDELAKMMDTSDAWIHERTGIRERHFVDDGIGTSDLALEASRRALDAARIDAEDIDHIILATLSPDFTFPGSAVLLQEKLGIGTVGALDVRNQCSGFLYGLAVADAFIRAGQYRRILLVGSEVHSTGLDLTSRGRDLAVLFGDGAGAVVLGASEDGTGVRSVHLHADGKHVKKLWLEAPASVCHPRITAEMLREGRHYPQMEGRAVFKHAVMRFPQVIREALNANSVDLTDVKLFILHQANLRIVEAVASSLGVPMEKFHNNIGHVGNTTAASIPIALDEAVRQGRIQEGEHLVLAAFGSGFTWASALVVW